MIETEQHDSKEPPKEGVLKDYDDVIAFLREKPVITDLFLSDEKLNLARIVAARTDLNWSSIYREFRDRVKPSRRDLFTLKICTDKYFEMLKSVEKRKRGEIEPVGLKKDSERYKFEESQSKVETPKQKGRRGETDTSLLVQYLETDNLTLNHVRVMQEMSCLREINILRRFIDNENKSEKEKDAAEEKLNALMKATAAWQDAMIAAYQNLSAQLKKLHEPKPSVPKAIRVPEVQAMVAVEENVIASTNANHVPPAKEGEPISIEVQNSEPLPTVVDATINEQPKVVEQEKSVVEVQDTQTNVNPQKESEVKMEVEDEKTLPSLGEQDEHPPNTTVETVEIPDILLNPEMEESTSETIVETAIEETVPTVVNHVIKEEPELNEESTTGSVLSNEQASTEPSSNNVVIEEEVKTVLSPITVTDSTAPLEPEPSIVEIKDESNSVASVATPEVSGTLDTPTGGNSTEKRRRRRRTHLSANTIQTRSTRSQGTRSEVNEPGQTPVVKVEENERGVKKHREDSSIDNSEESNEPKTPMPSSPAVANADYDDWVRTRGFDIMRKLGNDYSHVIESPIVKNGYAQIGDIFHRPANYNNIRKRMDDGSIKTRADFIRFTNLMLCEFRIISNEPKHIRDVKKIETFLQIEIYEVENKSNKRLRTQTPEVKTEVGQKRKTRRSNGSLDRKEGIPRKYTRKN